MEVASSTGGAKGATSRAHIVASAVALSRRAGLDALTFGRVARAAGFSKSAVLKHFGSRANLQAATIDALAHDFRRLVMAPAEGRCGLDRLRRLFTDFLAWMAEGCPLAAASVSSGGLSEVLQARAARGQSAWRQTLCEAVMEAGASGEIGALDAGQASFELIGAGLAYRQAISVAGGETARALAWQAFEHALGPARRQPTEHGRKAHEEAPWPKF